MKKLNENKGAIFGFAPLLKYLGAILGAILLEIRQRFQGWGDGAILWGDVGGDLLKSLAISRPWRWGDLSPYGGRGIAPAPRRDLGLAARPLRVI
jgi:hypothetical protein